MKSKKNNNLDEYKSINILEFNKIMDETINWYESIKENQRLESLLEIARRINA